MTNIDIMKTRDSLAHYARKARKDPIIVTRTGRPMAAVVSLEDADWETINLSLNSRFIALINKARRQQKRHPGYTTEEVRHQLRLDEPHEKC